VTVQVRRRGDEAVAWEKEDAFTGHSDPQFMVCRFAFTHQTCSSPAYLPEGEAEDDSHAGRRLVRQASRTRTHFPCDGQYGGGRPGERFPGIEKRLRLNSTSVNAPGLMPRRCGSTNRGVLGGRTLVRPQKQIWAGRTATTPALSIHKLLSGEDITETRVPSGEIRRKKMAILRMEL